MVQIKRLQLDIEFEDSSVHVFHTGYLTSDEYATSITMDDREFMGEVECTKIDGGYIITVRKTVCE